MNKINMRQTKVALITHLILWFGCCGSVLAAKNIDSPQFGFKPGIYALAKGGAAIPNKVLAHPDVVGVSVRDKWKNLELQEGQFDWRYFDSQFARINKAGKQISLLLTYGGMALPDWLYTKDIEFFNFTNKNAFSPRYKQQMRIPVFWDATALQFKKQLIEAMGQRYANYPGLTLVTAQCGNALTGDWNIPKSKQDIKQWQDLGYSANKLIASCQKIIDYTMRAFPQQTVKMAIGPVPAALGDKPNTVAKAIVQYAQQHYPGRFLAQRNNLSVTSPDPSQTKKLRSWKVLWNHRPAVGAQFLWHAADTTRCRLNGKRKPCDSASMLKAALDIAMAYEVSFIEVYTKDLLQAYGRESIHDVAQSMHNHFY